MTLSTVTVTWDENDIGQAPLGGNITFLLSEPVFDSADGIDVRPTPKTYFFASATGTGTSDPLVANDNASLQPAGSYYTVTVAITGQAPYVFQSAIDHANGASQTLSFLQANAAVPAAQFSAYLPLPSGTPAAGQVPAVIANGSTATAWTTGSSSYLPLSGGTLTGPLVISDTPSASPGSLPIGYGDSTALTGLQVASSYPSDDVSGGTDGTGRLLLYSYQRANAYSFGETIRNFLMRWDAKAMTAWYGPNDLYDGSGNAIGTGGWSPWTWVGSHYEANSHDGVHGHWEVEVPDSTGALQGRFEVTFANQTTGVIGLDKTTISTNLADFHFLCHGTDHTGAYQEQTFRLTAPAGFEKALEWNNDGSPSATLPRWRVAATADTESGSNAGTNWALYRFSDGGSQLDSPISVNRQTGGVSLGSTTTTAGVTVTRSGGIALTISQPGAAAAGVQVISADTTSAAYQAQVTGDTNNRLQILSTGQHNWGTGAAASDTNLYRSSAGVLKTDNTFHVGTTLRLNTTSLGGGVGVFAIANATTNPSTTPSGGGILYASAGALSWKGSNGTVTTIASA